MMTSSMESVPRDAPASTGGEKLGRRPKSELSGVRKLIFDRMCELDLTLADMSRSVGKNNAYMHQFIYKGTPRRLDEDARIILGGLLKLSPDQLRDARQYTFARQAVPAPNKSSPVETACGNIPLFRESEVIDTRRATSWVASIPTARGLAAFALWIELPRGRLAPGDIIFASPDQPVRRADIVALLSNQAIVCIGEVHDVSATSIAVDGLSGPIEYARSEVQIFKVIGAAYP